MMSFYQREEKTIQEDEQDNILISKLVQNYQDIKEKYEALVLQNDNHLQEIQQLKETNSRLVKEIAQLRQKQHNEEANQTIPNLNQTKQDRFLLSHKLTPTILNKTIQRTIHAQQTKRRVINGFVEQLTQELQQSQDLLKKERIMQDQTRRTLMICNEQLMSLRITVKGLQSRIAMLSAENQQLLLELQTSIHEKRLLQQKLSTKTLQFKKLKGTFMMNVEQFEEEMIKMDSIYHNIELALDTLQ